MSAVTLDAIGAVVEPVLSWTPRRDDPKGSFTYINLSAVDQDNKVVTEAHKLMCVDAPSRARQKVRAGDVLVSTVRPNLNGVAQVPPDLDGATASTGFCVLRAKPRSLYHRYLYQWVKSPRFVGDMVRKATGASYPAVSDRIVAESTIPLPPIAEQKRIAAILDKADALRVKRRAALAKLDELTQSIFLDLFGDPATNPKHFERASLQCYLDPIKNWNPASEPKAEIYYIDIGSVDQKSKTVASARRILGKEAPSRARQLVQAGDVLVSTVRPNLNAVALVPDKLNGATASTGFCVLRPKQGEIKSEYLFALVRSQQFIGEMVQQATGASYPAVTDRMVRAWTAPIPPFDLQLQFSGYISCIAKLLRIQQQSLIQQDNLFASLQQRAFRGEL